MRSALIALTWELWRKHVTSSSLALGLIMICGASYPIFAAPIRTSDLLSTLSYLPMVASLIFVFASFNHTEFNSGKQWTGFPYRQFVLPVPTWLLVAWPMLLGVAAVTAVYLIWARVIFPFLDVHMPLWTGVFLAVGMAGFQSLLWSLAAFRTTRIVALAFLANVLVGIALMPIANGSNRPTDATLSLLMLAGPAGFVVAWISVSRQRHSGGAQQKWLPWLAEKLSDLLPRRTASFKTPAAAQFWFEWRRAGWMLPLAMLLALTMVFAPISWLVRDDPNQTLAVLAWLLGLPLILSAFIGKGYAKPDFWSGELAFPNFLAARPLSSSDIVVTKMKVAALTTILAWLPIAIFVSAWLPGWADSRRVMSFWWLARADLPLWKLGAILGLIFFTLVFLTWRNMVRNLWAGLSGKKSLYYGSAVLDVIVFAGAFAVVMQLDEFIARKSNILSLNVFWLATTVCVVVLAKLVFSTISWRRIAPRETTTYVLLWVGGTLIFATFAWLITPEVGPLRYLLLLATPLLFPLARIGFSQHALAKNRNR